MYNFQKKNYYITTNTNFNRSLNLKKCKKSLSNVLLSATNQNEVLPLLNLNKIEATNKEKFIIKLKKPKKTSFYKSQEKLQKTIKEEDTMKLNYFSMIKNKVKESDDEFSYFLIESHENELPDDISNENNNGIDIEQFRRNINTEDKKIYSIYRKLGNDEFNMNDYQRRHKLLFPGEQIMDENYFNKKVNYIITIQRLFRKYRIKRKIYIGLEEPDYLIRIYEHDYDIYPHIKSIEIMIYSTLFKKNVTMIKTIEELLGVESITREKIQKKIGQIIDEIIGSNRNGRRRANDDYYNPDKADLSSDDFNDFEDDDD